MSQYLKKMDKNLFDYIQILSLNDKKTLSQKALKVSEETGELAKVVLPFDNAHGTRHRFIEKNKILEECSDVILTAISIAYDLGYTHEEIEESLMAKATKWQSIQTKESRVNYPIPYEIHVTVKIISESQIKIFKQVCEECEVKPVIIDLENSGEFVMRDVMTSSHHIGNNTTAYYEAMRIDEVLRKNGFIVARVKIETVPWHPAAPQNIHDEMPKDCYFEAHVGCIITEKEKELLNYVAIGHESHISRNVFKKLDGERFVNMITLRKYEGNYSDFTSAVNSLTSELKERGIEFEKVITEFSIYDTRVSHDFIWLDKEENL